jgi:lipopolysaccharide transport system permease protein
LIDIKTTSAASHFTQSAVMPAKARLAVPQAFQNRKAETFLKRWINRKRTFSIGTMQCAIVDMFEPTDRPARHLQAALILPPPGAWRPVENANFSMSPASKRLALREGYLKIAPLNAESSIAISGPESPTPAILTQARSQKPTFRIRPTKGWAALNVRELWKFRDLLWILVERDIKVIYKQTALGMIWVALQPLIAAIILAVIFGRVARLPSDGVPYLLFVFCGLTPWIYFSQALQRGSNSVVRNSQLVSKVYFPRMLIPLSHTFAALVDFSVMLVVLFIFMAVYRVPPTLRLAAIPGFLFLMAITASGMALWFSALSVKYRDCNYALPFFIQIWMYASPVVYPTSMVPGRWQALWAVNPAVGFIEGFRWAVLGRSALNLNILFVSIIMSTLALLSGAFFFRRVERSFADII